MKNNKRYFSMAMLLGLTLVFSNVYANFKINDDVWHFQAFLDDDPIGYHYFEIKKEGSETTVYTVARFDVNFLFFNVYNYEHKNNEVWDGKCLKELTSSTNDNGKDLFVNLRTDEGRVKIATSTGETTDLLCVKSFAYWEPEMLASKKLLNTQTGELLDVKFEFAGNEVFIVNKNEIQAKHYRLLGKDIEIDLWYSLSNEWLGLRSKLDNGRYLRYVLVDRTSR